MNIALYIAIAVIIYLIAVILNFSEQKDGIKSDLKIMTNLRDFAKTAEEVHHHNLTKSVKEIELLNARLNISENMLIDANTAHVKELKTIGADIKALNEEMAATKRLSADRLNSLRLIANGGKS